MSAFKELFVLQCQKAKVFPLRDARIVKYGDNQEYFWTFALSCLHDEWKKRRDRELSTLLTFVPLCTLVTLKMVDSIA